MMTNEKLLNKDFEDVVIFFFSEPGAMGPNNMKFYKRNGESFSVNYMSEDMPYSRLKELFPVLKDCYFDGSMKREKIMAPTIVIGGSPDERETCLFRLWQSLGCTKAVLLCSQRDVWRNKQL